jgi:hypothetical protein
VACAHECNDSSDDQDDQHCSNVQQVGGCGSRKNVKKGKQGCWSSENLEKAMNAITDRGMKIREAARAYGIPMSSLRDHLYGRTKTRQRGKQPTLKPDEEKKIVDYIFKMQDLGHPLTPGELRLKVALATQTRKTP